MSARSRLFAALAGLTAAAFLNGCTTLPTSGDVETRPDVDPGAGVEAPYFAPPGPVSGESPEGVARGFLLAMQANPPTTAVARSFLSARARADWNPVGTVVYDGAAVTGSGAEVEVGLTQAHRIDGYGRWDPGAAERSLRMELSLVREGGEWRIDNPPDWLAAPASYFPSLYAPHLVYFFDRTRSVLVPTRVYLARGEQTASNLVRSLLAGPPRPLRQTTVSAIPRGTELDLGVVIDESGVAEVPLGPSIFRLPAAGLRRVAEQLAWTLRQVPEISAFRITVEGAAVPWPDGETEIAVDSGAAVDPVSASAADPVVIAGGQVGIVADGSSEPVAGPFGGRGFALGSVAMDPDGKWLAAVSANGRRLYQAPAAGPRAAGRVRQLIDGGVDLLPPRYDRFGNLWAMERVGGVLRARVFDSRGAERGVRLRGTGGARPAAFALTRDGARLVIATSGEERPRLLVFGISRDQRGRIRRIGRALAVDVSGGSGAAISIAQNGATSVAVLLQGQTGSGRVVSVELDGSPGAPVADQPGFLPGPSLAIAGSPDPGLPLLALGVDGWLYELDAGGQWDRLAVEGVAAVSYPG